MTDRIQQIKDQILDLVMETGNKDAIMDLFTMAALHQDTALMRRIAHHSRSPLDEAETAALKGAVELCEELEKLGQDYDQDQSIDVEDRIMQIAEDFNRRTNPDLEREAQQATDELLKRFSLN